MLLQFVGAKEVSNTFRHEVASYFDAPVFSFRELSDHLFDSMSGLFGMNKHTSLKTQDYMKLIMRENLTNIQSSLYIDWMTTQLVEKIFRKADNSSKKIQAVILDTHTQKEYKTIRTFLISPKFNKLNKTILLENEDVMFEDYNKNYDIYNHFDVDAVISTEDEESLDKTITGLLRKWHLS